MKLRWKPAWTKIVLLMLLFRLLYGMVGIYVVQTQTPQPDPSVEFYPAATLLKSDRFSEQAINPWFRWDAAWYLRIAAFGYDDASGSVAFAPLYGWLIRVFGILLGKRFLLAALLLSTLFLATSLILLYELFREKFEPILALLFFPTAFFFYAAYTESLFLMLVLLCLTFIKKRSWLWAGIVAGISVLARFQGIILSAVIVIAFLIDFWGLNEQRSIEQVKSLFRQIAHLKSLWTKKALLPISAAFIPFIIFWVYLFALAQKGLDSPSDALFLRWQIQAVPPWHGFTLFIQRLPLLFSSELTTWIDLSLLIMLCVMAILGFKKMPLSYSVYFWGTIAVLFTRGNTPHLLDSVSRYLLVVFPFVFPFINIPNKIRQYSLAATSLFIQFYLLKYFFAWYWVA